MRLIVFEDERYWGYVVLRIWDCNDDSILVKRSKLTKKYTKCTSQRTEV